MAMLINSWDKRLLVFNDLSRISYKISGDTLTIKYKNGKIETIEKWGEGLWDNWDDFIEQLKEEGTEIE